MSAPPEVPSSGIAGCLDPLGSPLPVNRLAAARAPVCRRALTGTAVTAPYGDHMPAMPVVPSRLVRVEDAPDLAALVCRNREFMAPWDPARPEEFFSRDGQIAVIEELLDGHQRGVTLPHVILDSSGNVVGRITGSIVRGALQSCGIGYWVSYDRHGRGLATAAVAHIKRIAFTELELHRLQAETLVHNVASQRVLERNGFERYGLAPQYLNIAGRWQDHMMFQVINPKV